MKFGDIVDNGWASRDNPQRKGIFIKYIGSGRRRAALITDGEGDFWEQPMDNNKLHVKGSVLKDDDN